MLRTILVVLVALGCVLVHGKSLAFLREYEKELVDSLDTSVNPCADFYNYTCNKLMPPHGKYNSILYKAGLDIGNDVIQLLIKAQKDNSVPEAVRKAAMLFQSCLDYPGQISFSPLSSTNLAPERRKCNTFIKQRPLVYKNYSKEKLSQCMNRVTEGMKYATDYLYNIYGRHEPSIDDIVKMIGYIKKGFLQNIEIVDWTDIKFKTYVRKLISDMKFYVGYPTWVKNVTLLNDYYASIKLTGDWTLDIKAVDIVKSNPKNNTVSEDNNWLRWFNPSTTVIAHYYPSLNVFHIPTGITVPPMYDPQQPPYINYGSLGFIIAHEMTHSVDSIRNENWTEMASDEYKKRKNCLIKQYESVLTEGNPMNGTHTIKDNVADNGAIHHMYQGYHSWVKESGYRPVTPYYTADQFLYIGLVRPWCSTNGDYYSKGATHSPSHVRMLVPLFNSEEFASAYRCNPGDYMAKQPMCRIW